MWLVFGLILLLLSAAVILILKKQAGSPPRRFNNSDIIKVILSLDAEVVDDLFDLYAREFGREAARYARRTREKWRAGKVRPNKQTFDRLLVRLPAVMSFDLKCEVLRKLREEYCAKDRYQLSVSTTDWREAITPLVNGIIEKSHTAELPKRIEERLKWLSADDMRVARAILAESQARESRNAVNLLEREFESIERLIEEGGGRSRVTHTLRLPLGTITLKIKEG